MAKRKLIFICHGCTAGQSQSISIHICLNMEPLLFPFCYLEKILRLVSPEASPASTGIINRFLPMQDHNGSLPQTLAEPLLYIYSFILFGHWNLGVGDPALNQRPVVLAPTKPAFQFEDTDNRAPCK